MSPRKREERGEPIIVDGQVVGFQLSLPDPDKETKRASPRRRATRHQATAEPKAQEASP
jgi:hypothetical protein